MLRMTRSAWSGVRHATVIGLLLASAATVTVVQASAQASLHHRFNVMGETVGVVGYDPVSYFPEGGGRPQKGLIGITVELNNVTYRFASEEHKKLFEANPSKYQPSYGGWCAWAVGAIAKRVDVDPESYVIRDGKLYLFYRDPALDTRALWLKDTESLLRKAEANWPALSQ